MFKKIWDLIDNFFITEENIENAKRNYLSTITDEIVLKATFTPIRDWWVSMIANKLVIDRNNNYIFKSRIYIPILYVYFIYLFFFFPYLYQNVNNFSFSFFINLVSNTRPILIPLVLFSLPLVFWIEYYILDFQNWYFYTNKNRKKLIDFLNTGNFNDKFKAIKDIHAIQILNEKVKYKRWYYLSYELNLILKDSSRINLTDHYNVDYIRKNAITLSNRLWVKVYDITNI